MKASSRTSIKPTSAIIPTSCASTSATRRTCSRCSGTCSPGSTSPTRAVLQQPGLLAGAGRPDDRAPSAAQPPYYIVAQAPGRSEPVFQLTSALNALSPGEPGRVRLGRPAIRRTTARCRCSSCPAARRCSGRGRYRACSARPRRSPDELSLLNQHGFPRSVYGNLLTLPVGGGLLYVEPLYVQAQGAAVPAAAVRAGRLRQPGRRSRRTLSDALDQALRCGRRRAGTGRRAGRPTTPTPTPSGTATAAARPTPPPTGPAGPGGTLSPELSAALNQLADRVQRRCRRRTAAAT